MEFSFQPRVRLSSARRRSFLLQQLERRRERLRGTPRNSRASTSGSNSCLGAFQALLSIISPKLHLCHLESKVSKDGDPVEVQVLPVQVLCSRPSPSPRRAEEKYMSAGDPGILSGSKPRRSQKCPNAAADSKQTNVSMQV